MVPAMTPKKIRCRDESPPLLGLQPLSINRLAEAVNNAKIKIIGFVGNFTLTRVPTGANKIIEIPNGMATFHSIIFFLAYVQAAEELFTTFKSMPRGIACVLKSIPNQNRIGIYSCDLPNPIIAKTNAMKKNGRRKIDSVHLVLLLLDIALVS